MAIQMSATWGSSAEEKREGRESERERERERATERERETGRESEFGICCGLGLGRGSATFKVSACCLRGRAGVGLARRRSVNACPALPNGIDLGPRLGCVVCGCVGQCHEVEVQDARARVLDAEARNSFPPPPPPPPSPNAKSHVPTSQPPYAKP